MSNLTAREVQEVLLEDYCDGYWGELSWQLNRRNLSEIEIDGVKYPINVIEEEDGGDREWEYDEWVVFSVGDQIFKVSGTYRSHDGTTWNELEEVHAVEKTISVWEPVK